MSKYNIMTYPIESFEYFYDKFSDSESSLVQNQNMQDLSDYDLSDSEENYSTATKVKQ